MPEYSVVTAREAERFKRLSGEVKTSNIPVYLDHDTVVEEYWSRLPGTFPDYQFCLVEEATGRAVARGNCIPVAYEEPWSSLPDEGFDWVLARGFQDLAEGRKPAVLSALYIVVSDAFLNNQLSAKMLDVMKQIGRDAGLSHLIVPLRPSLKSRYPLIDIDEYSRLHNKEGEPFDPWLRVHVRAGGEIIHPCHRAMTVTGTREEWMEWTGTHFPVDGRCVVPDALVPITFSGETGTYIEPGIWVVHEL